MKIAFAEPDLPRSGAAVVGICEERLLTPAARRLDQATDGAITRTLAGAARFSGKKGELLPIVAPAKLPLGRIVLAGLGKPEKADGRIFEELGGALAAHLNGAGESEATVAVDVTEGMPIAAADAAAAIAFGAALRSYRFDKYKTKQKPEQKAVPGTADGSKRRRGCGAARLSPARTDRRGGVLHPRPGVRTGQCDLSRDAWPRGAYARKVRGRGRGARRKGNARTRNGRACSASPRAAHGRRGSSSCNGTAPARRRAGRTARVYRQGGHFRHRRHLDQARRRHGRDEMGYGGIGRRHRADAALGGAQGQGRTRSASSAWSRTCPPARRSGQATSSPRCRAKRSRC